MELALSSGQEILSTNYLAFSGDAIKVNIP